MAKRVKLRLDNHFCAAHCLPNHPGECKNVHGHTWKVRTTVEGVVDEGTGMLIDFKDLKRRINPAINQLDHSFMNNFPYFTEHFPTAENIAEFLYTRIREALDSVKKVSLVSVEVWESDNASAVYEGAGDA